MRTPLKNLALWSFTVSLLFLGCSDYSDLRLRHDCERLFYSASNELEQQYLLQAGRDPVIDQEVIEAFRKVVERFWREGLAADIPALSQAQKQAWYLTGKAHLKIGELYSQNRNYPRAEDELRKIPDNYPLNPYQSALALCYCGTIAELQGDYQKALDDYERIMEDYRPTLEDQNTPEPLLMGVPILRAEVFKKRRESEEFHAALDRARSYYRRLYNENPNALLAAAALGKIASTYLLESQPSTAIETLSELKDEQGRFPSPVMLRIAQIYLDHARDYRPAEKAFSGYLDLYPDSDEAVLAQLGLGLSLFHQREYKKAADEFLSVEKNYPRKWQQFPKAHFLYAQCFEKMGDWQRALTEFNWVKANFPATPEGLEVPYYIAQYYEKSGEKKLAQDSFERGIEFYRKIVDTYSRTSMAPIAQNYIAKCLLALGRWREAAESFQALAERFPGSRLASASLLAAADIYRVKLDDKTRAANSLREYLERFPHYPHAEELREEIESLEA